jgi:hypothetical protein
MTEFEGQIAARRRRRPSITIRRTVTVRHQDHPQISASRIKPIIGRGPAGRAVTECSQIAGTPEPPVTDNNAGAGPRWPPRRPSLGLRPGDTLTEWAGCQPPSRTVITDSRTLRNAMSPSRSPSRDSDADVAGRTRPRRAAAGPGRNLNPGQPEPESHTDKFESPEPWQAKLERGQWLTQATLVAEFEALPRPRPRRRTVGKFTVY